MDAASRIRLRAQDARKALQQSRALLLVIDTVLDFDAGIGADGMSLARFIDVLQTRFTVVAQRYSPTENAFRFADPDAGLPSGCHAAVLLFGFASEGQPGSAHAHLPQSEIEAFRAFMDAGGGVFAAGDHSTVGQFLSGRIPRVRHLRRWEEPRNPAAGAADASRQREDTLPSMFGLSHKSTLWSDNGQLLHYALESDGAPQRIFPNFLLPGSTGSDRGPHPLLQMPGGGVINVMPDHAHEGVCRLPSEQELAEAEWPAEADRHIEIVAKAMSSGNGYSAQKQQRVNPLTPSEFANIVAYDGTRCGQGRIVTQSSWHHFLDLNLDDIVARNPDAWRLIRQYYLNLADWLCEPRLKAQNTAEWHLAESLGHYPLIETVELSDYQSPQDTEAATRVGEALLDALPQQLTPYRLSSVIEHCLQQQKPNDDKASIAPVDIAAALGRTALQLPGTILAVSR